MVEGAEDVDTEVEITPSKVATDGVEGELEGTQKTGRLANGLLYWVTTTSTSTLTSYTATLTIGSLQCTPAGNTLELCGK